MTLRESLDRCCRGVASTQEGDEVRAAVLNLIEAAQRFVEADEWMEDASVFVGLERAVAVFVSGQEDERRSP